MYTYTRIATHLGRIAIKVSCVYEYIYIHILTYIHTYIYIYIYTYTYSDAPWPSIHQGAVCTYTHICIYTHTHTYQYLYSIYKCICIGTHLGRKVIKVTYEHIYKNTHIHLHINLYVCVDVYVYTATHPGVQVVKVSFKTPRLLITLPRCLFKFAG